MSSAKKRDKSPYKHIQAGLIPATCAGLTAVPRTPPPSPPVSSKKKKKDKKKKIVVSPIIPFALYSTAAVRSVALGSAGNELENLEVQYETVDRSNANISGDCDDVYARIQRRPLPDVEVHLPPRHDDNQIIEDDQDGDDVVDTAGRVVEQMLQQEEEDENENPDTLPPHEEDITPSDVPEEDLEEIAGSDDEQQTKLKEKQKRALHAVQAVVEMKPKKVVEVEIHPNKNANSNKQSVEETAVKPIHVSHQASSMNQILLERQEKMEEELKLRDEENKEILMQFLKKGTEGGLGADRGAALFHANEELREENEYLKLKLMKLEKKFADETNRNEESEMTLRNTTDKLNATVEENKTLRELREKAESEVSQGKWDLMRRQNNLMVEEIQMLTEEIQLLHEKMKDNHKKHVNEVDRMQRRINDYSEKYDKSEKERNHLKDQMEDFETRNEILMKEIRNMIPSKEHNSTVERLKKDIEDLNEEKEKENKLNLKKIQDLHAERTQLSLELNDTHGLNRKLEAELSVMTAHFEKTRGEVTRLEEDLTITEQQHLTCQLHLANMIRMAEQSMTSQNAYQILVENEQKTRNENLHRSMHEKWEMGKMEESLRNCKVQLMERTNDVNDRLHRQQEVYDTHVMQLQREIQHLKRNLNDKDEEIAVMKISNREIENELENVWKATHTENKILMRSLHSSA